MIVQHISKELGLSPSYLETLARTASHRYKTYPIKKRSGGERTIHHPARELKLIQGWLVEKVLSRLSVHPLATAYQRGSSIQKNATLHIKNNYLLRVDFCDFFPSLKSSDVTAMLWSNQHHKTDPALTSQDISFITAIACCNGALTIGAPSSPTLSNALMFTFDEYWAHKCFEMGVTYSRYADDLYFSTNFRNVLSQVFSILRSYVSQQSSPRLQINDKKTVFTSRKRRKLVTGLVLTSDRRISIGRSRKRLLKSMIFQFISGKVEPDRIGQIEGWIAYVRSVEPSFVSSLERKYGVDLKATFLKARTV